MGTATRKLLALCCLTATLVSVSALSDDTPCFQSISDWAHWKSAILSDLGPGPDLLMRVEVLARCSSQPEFATFLQNPEFKACMTPLLNFSKAVDGKNAMEALNGDGVISMKREDYLNPAKLPFPRMLDIDARLLERSVFSEWSRPLPSPPSGDDPDGAIGLRKAFSTLTGRIPGLQSAFFDSPIQPPNVSGKQTIVILVPGKQYDQYYHFVQSPTGIGSALVLAIQKQDPKTGKTLKPPLSFFNEVRFSKRPASPHGKQPGSPLNSCVACHRTGGIDLFPKGDRKVISLAGDSAAKAIRNQIRGTRDAVPFALRQELMGPSIGEVDLPSRTDSFIRQCMGNNVNGGLPVRPDQVDKIRKAMNCQSCHGSDSGKLAFPMGMMMMAQSFIDHVLAEGKMPPGADRVGKNSFLEPELRQGVRNCILAEYYGGMKGSLPGLDGSLKDFPPGTYLRSLLEPPCVPPQGASNLPSVAPAAGLAQ